jgi:hypothetical protein
VNRAAKGRVKAAVAAKVAQIERSEARTIRRADVAAAKAIAAQVCHKPQTADFEPRYVSKADAERIARHTPGARVSATQSEPEPRRYVLPPLEGRKRRGPREHRTGVIARGVDTGTLDAAHRYAHNLAGCGIVAEVRRSATGTIALFAPCAPVDAERMKLAFARRGFATVDFGDDKDLPEFMEPPNVRESVDPFKRTYAPAPNWSPFDAFRR